MNELERVGMAISLSLSLSLSLSFLSFLYFLYCWGNLFPSSNTQECYPISPCFLNCFFYDVIRVPLIRFLFKKDVKFHVPSLMPSSAVNMTEHFNGTNSFFALWKPIADIKFVFYDRYFCLANRRALWWIFGIFSKNLLNLCSVKS